MGQVIRREQCPVCLDTGRDNLVIYDDGGSFCFACGSAKRGTTNTYTNERLKVTEVSQLKPVNYLEATTEETTKRYGVKVIHESTNDSYCLAFPLTGGGGTIDGYHYREIDFPNARLTRNMWFEKGQKIKCPLFGWHLYNTKHTTIVVCEGETDTLSLASQKLPGTVLVVGVIGATSAKKAASWLLAKASVKEVVLAFDHDDAGWAAEQEFINKLKDGVFGGKISRLQFDAKDVKAAILSGTDLTSFPCCPILSNDIKGSQEIRKDLESYLLEINNQSNITLEFSPTLSSCVHLTGGKLYGVIGQEGCGKSTFVEHIMIEAITQRKGVFCVSAEMRASEVALKLARIVHGLPYHKPSYLRQLDAKGKEQLNSTIDKTLSRLHITDTFGENATVEHISSCIHELDAIGEKPDVVIIDHFLAMVNLLEGFSVCEVLGKQLKEMALKHRVTVVVICHISKPPKQRKREVYRPQLTDAYGGGLGRYCDCVLAIARDLKEPITFVETVKIDRMVGEYCDVQLVMKDYQLNEKDQEELEPDDEEEDLY